MSFKFVLSVPSALAKRESSIGDIINKSGRERLGILNSHPRGSHLQLVGWARAGCRVRGKDARVAQSLVSADDIQAGEVMLGYGEGRKLFVFDAIVDTNYFTINTVDDVEWAAGRGGCDDETGHFGDVAEAGRGGWRLGHSYHGQWWCG